MLNDQGEDEMVPLWKRLAIASIVGYSLIFALGTIGNGLVIFITGFRMKKTVNTVWILNLAIANFTFSFFLIFPAVHISLDYHWPFGMLMCKLSVAMNIFSLFAGIYLLVVISVDHCIAIWCPVWAQNHRTSRWASFVVLGVWILALVFCSPVLYFTETYYFDGTNITYCFSDFSMIEEIVGSTYTLISIDFIFNFIIPFAVIVVCYGAIVVRFRREQLSSKPFKVITAVIVAFFICWFPYHVFSFLAVKAFNGASMHVILFIGLTLSYMLACFNSCLNPILYFCMGHSFKEKLKCPFLSTFENALTEEINYSNTSASSSTEVNSHGL